MSEQKDCDHEVNFEDLRFHNYTSHHQVEFGTVCRRCGVHGTILVDALEAKWPESSKED